jgi:hypothetical protein
LAAAPAIPAGFAVCQLNQSANSPLALQLVAQQQALIAAREEALRVTLSRLKISLNQSKRTGPVAVVQDCGKAQRVIEVGQ